jgi:hypothetical protein
MKKALLTCLLGSFLIVSCSKDDPAPVNPSADVFMNFDPGATWEYELKNNTPPASTTTYTVTSSNRDTTLGGRVYHIFETSTGGFEFYATSGSDYYTYYSFPDPINEQAEFLYLKANAAVGTSWQAASIPVNVGIPITVVVTNTIMEKGISRTVNGQTYTNVTRVSSVVTAPGVPIAIDSDIQWYFAENYGLIESSIELSSAAFPESIDTDSRLLDANF